MKGEESTLLTGVRRAKESNISMLGKLAWEVLQNSNKLWVQVLSQKYTSGQNGLLSRECPRSASFCWKSIHKAAQKIKTGWKWRVGDGSGISLWNDFWLEGGPLSLAVDNTPANYIDMKVVNLIQNGAWNLNTIKELGLGEFSIRIIQIPLPLIGEMEDKIIWSVDTNGKYNASFGYRWLNGFDGTTQENACSVPTNALRFHRHVAHSAACSMCNAQLEDIGHCFRDCSTSRQVWRLLGFDVEDESWTQEAIPWIISNLKVNHISSSRQISFACSLRGLWIARNEEVLGNNKMPILGVVAKINALINTCMFAFQVMLPQPDKNIRWVCWEPPDMGVFKINVDGSNLGNPGRAGFGGVCRNQAGSWMIGFAGWIGDGINLIAELQTIYHGLNIAWQQGWRSLVCEFDSLEAVDLITNADITFHAYASVINDIRHLIRLDWAVEMKHVLREANQIVDYLAMMGAKGHHRLNILQQPPLALANGLLVDSMSISFPRL